MELATAPGFSQNNSTGPYIDEEQPIETNIRKHTNERRFHFSNRFVEQISGYDVTDVISAIYSIKCSLLVSFYLV